MSNITLSPANFPWHPITPEESLRKFSLFEIFQLVFRYQQELRLLVLEHLHRNTFLELADLSEGETIIPPAEMFNMVETNLRNLVAADVPQGLEVFHGIWRGWTADERPPDFTDVNRWFRTIQLMNSLMLAVQPQFLTTNFFVLGAELPHQVQGITMPYYGDIPPSPIVGTLGDLWQGDTVYIIVNDSPRRFTVLRQGAPNANYAGWGNSTFLIQSLVYETGQWGNSSVRDYANSVLHTWLNTVYIGMFPAWLQPLFTQGQIPFIPGNAGTVVAQGANGLLCRVFAPSLQELNASGNSTPQGANFGLFTNNASRISRNAATDEPAPYHSRNFNFNTAQVQRFTTAGGVGNVTVTTGTSFHRPIFALPPTVGFNSDRILVND
jgi:hypothetical protein